MVDIETNRGLSFKSWKMYAKALEIELKSLQQFAKDEHIILAFKAVKRSIKQGRIRGEIINDM